MGKFRNGLIWVVRLYWNGYEYIVWFMFKKIKMIVKGLL